MSGAYQVLARKYRPQRLKDLVGQQVLVDTLTRALSENRLPHAILFHGTRGVGKTTTARILAKAMNCIGEQREGMEPCGICQPCLDISNGRFFDVVEMDAASHTGVDDIRELIESARYKALSGKYKVYIIDEVHMLSKSAFNALLKTLEEPPASVVFIFATTELRRVPDTILSRCMRFDLRRLESELLAQHLQNIAQQESITLEPQAALMLGQAADGSARDALSLLDQAIALGGKNVLASHVRNMLGLADRGHVLTLIQLMLEGQAAEALNLVQSQQASGADPVLLTEDLLDALYGVACLKAAPQAQRKMIWTTSDLATAQELAQKADMSLLTQTWQVMQRGYEEVYRANHPGRALEMLVLRLTYLAPLPTAHQLLAQHPKQEPSEPNAVQSQPMPGSFEAVMNLLKNAREPILFGHMTHDVHLVSYQPGHLVLRARSEAPNNMGAQLRQFLEKQTHTTWRVDLVADGGQDTLAQQAQTRRDQEETECRQDPAVQSLLSAFPGATLQVENV